jgi:peroxiredoxin
MAVVLLLQVDVTRIGPAVGAAAPAFSLIDQTGRTQTLASVAGPQGTMLVFFRSADW